MNDFGAYFKNKIELFPGMYVMHPETYRPVKISEINDYGSVYLGESRVVWGRSTLYPASITPERLGSFGFGTFKYSDKDYYHEPKEGDPDHDFYGEANIEEQYLFLQSKQGEVTLNHFKYIHQLQRALIEVGFPEFASKVIFLTGSTIKLL